MIRSIDLPEAETIFIMAAMETQDVMTVHRILAPFVPDDIAKFRLIVKTRPLEARLELLVSGEWETGEL